MNIIKKGLSIFLVLLFTFYFISIFSQETDQPTSNNVNVSTQEIPPEVSKKAREYKGSKVPPKNLIRQADGHYTPYNPPQPKEGDYIIQPGDTLSTLAQQKLGNWLLWPLIWDKNPYILDAHWIYPGDPLTLPEEAKIIGKKEEEEGEEEEALKEEIFQIEEEAELPPVNAKDIYCSGFITNKFRMPSLRIVSSGTRSKESLGEGDIVYLNGGSLDGVIAGNEYFIISEGPPIYHSVSGHYLGKLYEKVGKVKVLCTQEKTSIAQITLSCDEVRYGMGLLPFTPIPFPWNVKASPYLPICEQKTNKLRGKVIWTEDRLEAVGQNNIIYADFGANQQVMPGDKFWIYRYSTGEDTLVTSIDDLFKQQKIDVPYRDLFRENKISKKKIKNPHKELKKGKDSRLPEGYEAKEKEESINELTETAGDSRLPRNIRKSEMVPSGDIESLRKYVGEAIVISTQGETSCLKVITSLEEVKLGDTLELE